MFNFYQDKIFSLSKKKAPVLINREQKRTIQNENEQPSVSFKKDKKDKLNLEWGISNKYSVKYFLVRGITTAVVETRRDFSQSDSDSQTLSPF